VLTWGCLPTKNNQPRLYSRKLIGGHGPVQNESMDHSQDIEQLALVLVDAFGLDVEQKICTHRHSAFLLDNIGQPLLVESLDLPKHFNEMGIIRMFLKLRDFVQIQQP